MSSVQKEQEDMIGSERVLLLLLSLLQFTLPQFLSYWLRKCPDILMIVGPDRTKRSHTVTIICGT